ncbi:winged helix-turn-helix transcriptional regulator [Virgibacillus sp. MSP4-1]|uniref:winged helix-turn-helix transcriptional regulator n=1 Tax=Virgibacillus sp. MSP4-1 TaxID=2700081 RepID=UPI00039C6333|nr:winged helix-turn-helix transcriptional regulator [Virgibacillus sp. MSP4-1]QHS21573.1 winged helix-turn-helix transcriptional regulator [Virgibacillus sp. MSP4-1]
MKQYELCPKFEKAMNLLNKRWTGLIIYQLLFGSQRFSEIESALPVSGRLLSERLKELEEEGVVARKAYAEVPVRVEYTLTEKGRELEPVIKAIQDWSGKWISHNDTKEANYS